MSIKYIFSANTGTVNLFLGTVLACHSGMGDYSENIILYSLFCQESELKEIFKVFGLIADC
jgi:hypothetical protein